jgi:hypothetical protein
MREEGGVGVPRAAVVDVVVEVAGREGRQVRRDCGRRETRVRVRVGCSTIYKQTR